MMLVKDLQQHSSSAGGNREIMETYRVDSDKLEASPREHRLILPFNNVTAATTTSSPTASAKKKPRNGASNNGTNDSNAAATDNNQISEDTLNSLTKRLSLLDPTMTGSDQTSDLNNSPIINEDIQDTKVEAGPDSARANRDSYGQSSSVISQAAIGVNPSMNIGSLVSLAKAGRLSKTQSLFDVEIINNEEKAIIAIGDGWEWNVPKRLLSSITELYLVHMKRDTIVAKLAGNSAYLSSLMNLKKIYFLNNDFTSLKQLEFVHHSYGSFLEHLVIRECPIVQSAPVAVRSLMINHLPKLQTFNEEKIAVHLSNQETSERGYRDFFATLKAKNEANQTNSVTTAASSKKANMSKEKDSGVSGAVASKGGAKTASNKASTVSLGQTGRVGTHVGASLGNYEEFSSEFDRLIRDHYLSSLIAVYHSQNEVHSNIYGSNNTVFHLPTNQVVAGPGNGLSHSNSLAKMGLGIGGRNSPKK